jgi:hypothetical protein
MNARSASHRRLAAPLLALLLALPLGCNNPFTPADPPPPDGTAIPEDFSTIQSLLITVGIAIQTRSTNGADTYIHAMAESTSVGDHAFRAFYDPSVKATWLIGSQGQTAPEPWNLVLERGLHSELSGILPNAPYLFTWDTDPGHGFDQQVGTTNVWEVHRHYKLVAAPASGEPVIIAVGFADMFMIEQNSRFFIFDWHDRVDPAFGVNPADFQRSFSYYRLESQ